MQMQRQIILLKNNEIFSYNEKDHSTNHISLTQNQLQKFQSSTIYSKSGPLCANLRDLARFLRYSAQVQVVARKNGRLVSDLYIESIWLNHLR